MNIRERANGYQRKTLLRWENSKYQGLEIGMGLEAREIGMNKEERG